ncbi:transglycosylase family protein [Staphylococcus capitis]|uniref:transglycosylase family protein n=1 Tax=Staphylococcus capitis TaxID=29388 RepID=UPI00165581AF|nr:transglycosylase family protein [Staphylococcus capitis]MBC8781293.1 transglycosylase family protein [Staphylococcus capitis]MCM3508303.1 transglycosylase family protein [Staphylococcus capitis]MDH9600185.1 transglycosylase family protein [Staphylococcus capitis]MDH9624134.1 transglycosylase family protein [Staphylococcus capitis]MDS4062597.1 transglycosylase family protein [Staphylococcus capitis]
MKKSIIASSLAVALGVTGYSAAHGHEANAAENNTNQAHLADMAQNHPEQLNEKPVQDGSYDIHFTYNGFDYNFTSDGSYWKWSYKDSNLNSNQTATNSSQQQVNYNQVYTQNSNHAQSTSTQAETSNSSQANNYQVKTVSAPTTNNQSSNVNSGATSNKSASQATSTTRLGNGNTPGSTGSSAAQEMASRTGVPASTWEHIIARESNGQSNAKNPSGASGLFQTMPGWGSTATVQDQINTAEKVYNEQGMSAWNL